MQVIKKSSAGIQSLPLEAMLLAQRIIFLNGEITTDSADLILKQLLYLESEDTHEPVKLVINSPGGSVSAGLMLYQQIKGMELPIDIYCTEMAASMAAVILAGGRPGHRFIMKMGRTMIHEPLVSPSGGGISGSASSIQKTAESIMETKRVLTKLIASDTGHTVEEIEEGISFDNYMNAEESVAFGICDAVVERV